MSQDKSSEPVVENNEEVTEENLESVSGGVFIYPPLTTIPIEIEPCFPNGPDILTVS